MNDLKRSITVGVGICLATVSGSSVALDRTGTKKDHALDSSAAGRAAVSPGTTTELAQLLAGSGITVSNTVLTGAAAAAGCFTDGAAALSMAGGVVLSSGSAADILGPNISPSTTTAHLTPGDADLDTIPTFDAAVLEFDFVPTASSI